MRERLLEYLACPACRTGSLSLETFSRDGDHVIDGALTCRGCGVIYPVADGVPRMLPANLYYNPSFEARHRSRLAAIGWKPPARQTNDEFAELKQATSQVYGFEWTNWDRWGWEGGIPTEVEQQAFHHKSLLSPEDLRGKAVLDGGCGNGRYAATAARHCKDLIGLDLSAAVESSFKNLRDLPNAHVVQGDIMRPPIRMESLDAVYSIGVLMITGDTRKATESLSALLKPGGTITIHLYAAGFPVWQFNDTVVRAFTTQLSIPAARKVSQKMADAARWLDQRKMLGYACLWLRMWPDEVINFDWYATPKQTYHTYPEVHAWFREMQFEPVSDNERKDESVRGGPVMKQVRKFVWPEQMLTVRARKPSRVKEQRGASDERSNNAHPS